MDFGFTEEQKMWRATVEEFASKEAGREYARQCDVESRYPEDLYRKGVERGFTGLIIPPEYGGAGADAIHYAIFCECMARHSYEMASIFTSPMFTISNIVHWGTEEQKRRYLPAYVQGKINAAISLSEPDAGSDLASIKTRARLEGDHFVLNGAKQWSTGAGRPKALIAMAVKTDPEAPRRKGISVLLVPNDLPGMELQRQDVIVRKPIGTYSIFLNDVKVPRENILGKLNEGWEILTSHLELERLAAAACIVGEARQTLEDAMDYARKRVQFGQSVSRFQEIGHNLAQLYAELEGARLLVYRLAWMISKGMPAVREASIAKLVASEVFQEIGTFGMQTMGGYSFVPEMDMERHWRSAKQHTIGGGTSQIQRSIIAHSLKL